MGAFCGDPPPRCLALKVFRSNLDKHPCHLSTQHRAFQLELITFERLEPKKRAWPDCSCSQLFCGLTLFVGTPPNNKRKKGATEQPGVVMGCTGMTGACASWRPQPFGYHKCEQSSCHKREHAPHDTCVCLVRKSAGRYVVK